MIAAALADELIVIINRDSLVPQVDIRRTLDHCQDLAPHTGRQAWAIGAPHRQNTIPRFEILNAPGGPWNGVS